MRMVLGGDFSFFQVAEMPSPRQPRRRKQILSVWTLITKQQRSLAWMRRIAFWLPPPSGWRATARSLRGWMVKVIRQLRDISPWCQAAQAPHGPSPPHLLILTSAQSDEELVAVDHKKNIRAMSRKGKRGRRGKENRLENKRGEVEGEEWGQD